MQSGRIPALRVTGSLEIQASTRNEAINSSNPSISIRTSLTEGIFHVPGNYHFPRIVSRTPLPPDAVFGDAATKERGMKYQSPRFSPCARGWARISLRRNAIFHVGLGDGGKSRDVEGWGNERGEKLRGHFTWMQVGHASTSISISRRGLLRSPPSIRAPADSPSRGAAHTPARCFIIL